MEEALAALNPDELCADPDTLKEILLYHVVPGVLPSIQIAEGTSTVDTLQGSPVMLTFSHPGTDAEILQVNGATVVSADVGTNNGIIHVIDEVLEVPMPSKGECTRREGWMI